MPEAVTEFDLPYAFAKRCGVVLGELQDSSRLIWHRADTRVECINEVRRVLGCALRLQQVDDGQFERLLTSQYARDGSNTDAMMADMEGDQDLAQIAESMPEPQDLLESEDDAPIIRLINAVLSQAVRQNASDVHIEPFEDRLVVRLRVDGVLREVLKPPRVLGGLLVSRIKVMAKLDIAEKRVPQDGRISLRIAGRAVDVRVSTLPSAHGERAVLRLLDKQSGRLDLTHLGMPADEREAFARIIGQPHGMVLVTGPTGSGKTTTLYAALAAINDQSRNILTVEDPVEYYIDGIGQTQVNSKVELSFARSLRAILRQDPDVVMVGEIRDLETAQIAVQAGLTGHMVFSTLHTNSAAGAVTRLRDMGVEPFLLSSTLLCVVAQRLVRVLCGACREPVQAGETECRQLGLDASDAPVIHRPRGCSECGHTGYQGRTGIYEVLEVDANVRDLIHAGAGEAAISEAAGRLHPGIAADGRRRVLAGQTSLEELLRVTRSG